MGVPEYYYPSVGAALRRYYALLLELTSASSLPMNPDDLIQSARRSSEKAGLPEWLDLSRALDGLNDVESVVLFLEFTCPTEAVEGAPFGHNKTERVYQLCAVRMNGRFYVKAVRGAIEKVQEKLQAFGWIPARHITTKAQRPSSD